MINDIPLKNLDENLKIINENYAERDQEIKKAVLPDEDYFEDVDDEWDSDVEGLSIQAIELVLTILDKHEMQCLLYCGLYPLINTIMSFLLITKVQVKREKKFCEFILNLQFFIGKKMDFGA